jgi:hypothetical protein
MAHLFECDVEWNGILSVDKEGADVGFGGGNISHEIAKNEASAVYGTIQGGCCGRSLGGINGGLLRKKWPPAWLRAWGAER